MGAPSVALDTRNPLGLRGKIDPLGWSPPSNLPEAEWIKAGRSLGRAERSVMWWIGDWWAFGVHKYGDRRAIVEADGWEGPAYGTCKNAAVVCRKFERSRRRDGLSFTHHLEAAKVEESDKLLDWAEEPDSKTGEPRPSRDLRGQVKKIKRAAREEELGEAIRRCNKTLKSKRYGVLYADPPWRFEPYSRETGMDRAADNHYPTTDTDAIGAMSPPAADNAVLFLWATAPMICEALQVMRAWGFEYKSQIVWAKDRVGTGYWVRNKHELLLIGGRGSVPAPPPGMQPTSIIEAAVRQHSEKPTVFAEMVEGLYPNLPKLEMFARKKRAGWDSWGAEL